MERRATAIWEGDIRRGRGRFSTGSGTLKDTRYSFGTRFGSQEGSNPEELIAAAHASCFSMAVSAELAKDGHEATEIHTTAYVTLEKEDGDWSISAVHLDLVASAPGVPDDIVEEAAQKAKTACPISKLLKAPVTLNVEIHSSEAGLRPTL